MSAAERHGGVISRAPRRRAHIHGETPKLHAPRSVRVNVPVLPRQRLERPCAVRCFGWCADRHASNIQYHHDLCLCRSAHNRCRSWRSGARRSLSRRLNYLMVWAMTRLHSAAVCRKRQKKARRCMPRCLAHDHLCAVALHRLHMHACKPVVKPCWRGSERDSFQSQWVNAEREAFSE